MDKNEEIQSIEAEIGFIQNEIDRRHSRIDEGLDRERNHEKIEALRVQKNDLRERLAALKAS